jgi:hypothetical protein
MLNGSLSPRRSESLGRGGEDGLRIWSVAANVLDKQQQTAGIVWDNEPVGFRGVY